MEEIWKDVPEYEWYYQISNLGNMRSLLYWIKNLALEKNPHVYARITLCMNWIHTQKLVHRIVLSAFIWPSKLIVNHKNWIKNDNRLENLEYCTHSENQQHNYDVLWFKCLFQTNHPQKWKFGWNHNCSKKIIQLNKDGEHIKIWDSLIDAQRQLLISSVCISLACKWKSKTAWWFKWKYY